MTHIMHENKGSIFTVSAFITGDPLTGNPPSWEIIWEGTSLPETFIRLGAAKRKHAHVRMDWRDSDG